MTGDEELAEGLHRTMMTVFAGGALVSAIAFGITQSQPFGGAVVVAVLGFGIAYIGEKHRSDRVMNE